MRDIGILVWVVFLIVGVAGSMISSIRRQTQSAGAPRVQRRPAVEAAQQRLLQARQARAAAPPSGPAAVPVAPAPGRPAPPRPAARPRVETPLVHEPPRAATARRLFDSRPELVRAVIAAEVLGKPRALGSEYPWG